MIDNRTGAGGLIGNMLVSKANADGYTLGMVDVTRIITELMRDQPPYSALADVVGVAHVASITNVLAIIASIPARTAPDFVAYARARPAISITLPSASARRRISPASSLRAPSASLRCTCRSETCTTPSSRCYSGACITRCIRCRRCCRRCAKGALRALAVMTPQRSPALPSVPAIAEVGLPEAQFDSWSGVVAPKGTPRRIVEQLHGDIVRGLRKAALRELFVSQGAESTPEGTPDGFTRMMQVEYAKYQTMIRVGGIKPE